MNYINQVMNIGMKKSVNNFQKYFLINSKKNYILERNGSR